MKRIIAILAVAASLFSAVNASARGGIIGGFTASNTTLGSDFKNIIDTKSVSLYHVGLTYQMQLPAGFSIQPSILYQMKGMSLSAATDAKLFSGSLETKAGYLEVPVALQWGPDLVIARPYIFVEPFVGYRLTGYSNINDEWANKNLNKLEYGFGIGAGVELIQHLQVSIQWFANLGPVLNKDADKIVGSMVTALDQKNFNGIKVSAAFLF